MFDEPSFCFLKRTVFLLIKYADECHLDDVTGIATRGVIEPTHSPIEIYTSAYGVYASLLTITKTQKISLVKPTSAGVYGQGVR